jgi:2-keto-3-deoxy-L-arabinonate dehydratase
MKSFRGIFPIVNTPFHEDGSIDFESQRRLIHFLIDAGAHGLGLFGNASEGYTLAGAERAELLKIILEETNGRAPVIVSSGHTGTDVAVALSREAEAAGADAVMVLPPYYFKPDAEGVFQYFRAISEAIRIPIMVQDAPLMTQVAMGSALLARMARELENVRLAKIEAPPTAPKVSEVAALANGALTIFGGLNGQFLIEELQRGAVGTMPGSDMPDVFARIWNLYQSGEVKEARAEFTRYLPLIRYELQPGLGVSVMKHNLRDAGIIASARVRHPTRSLDAAGVRELRELREGLDLLAFSWERRVTARA